MKVSFIILFLAIIAAGCKKNSNPGGSAKVDVIYLENNNYNDNQNAVLAYYNLGNGVLRSVPGSPFFTGGSGISNPTQGLGPDDSDVQLKLSADGHFLLAVNPGSNSIAVFEILQDGSLKTVPGSPFASGGNTPVSIDVKNNVVFVVNKSMDTLHHPTANPNYTSFTISHDGWLTPIAGSTIETTPGSSPTQILVSKNQQYAFGADFLGFMLNPPQGTLRSFKIESSGILKPVINTPYTIPGMGGALGLWQHPNSNVLYVGFPVQSKVGIYSIGNSGELSFQSSVDAGAAACWIRTNSSGNNLYVLNSGENSVSVYNSSNALSPVSLGKLPLKESGPMYIAMGNSFSTSEDFGLAFSPDQNHLYVISQQTNPDFSVGNYNYLHTLTVGSDGMPMEMFDPLQLPVDATIRPQGLVVIKEDIGQLVAGKY